MESEKVLRALLDREWSTASDLAVAAQVNERTVQTVLQRNRSALEIRPKAAGTRGRPPSEYRVRTAWRPALDARTRPLEPPADPLVAVIEIVERAEQSLRAAENDEVRREVFDAARLQVSAARHVVMSAGRGDLALRLITAEARLNQANRGAAVPVYEVARAVASQAAVNAATIRPPRAAWEKWRERLSALADDFGAVWSPSPRQNLPSRNATPVAMMIDAIQQRPDAVSAKVISTLRSAGIPLVRFPSVNFQTRSARERFFGNLDDLIKDPISCLVPFYVAVDSSDAASKEIWHQIEELGERQGLGDAILAAREAIVDAAQSPPSDNLDVGEEAFFYGAFISHATAGEQSEDSASIWNVCRGPAFLDVDADQGLKDYASRLNCMYVDHAGEVDLQSRVEKWIYAAPMMPISESLEESDL